MSNQPSDQDSASNVRGTYCTAYLVKLEGEAYSENQVMWDTRGFNDPELWPEDGSQPFVLSTGDTTGYGQHGDYVFGWDGESLQKSMDSGCYLRNCSLLTEQVPKTKNACNVPVTIDEDIDGCEFRPPRLCDQWTDDRCRDGKTTGRGSWGRVNSGCRCCSIDIVLGDGAGGLRSSQ
jgi:hypothetical protein